MTADFFSLIQSGDRSAVESALAREPKLIYAKNNRGISAVMVAVASGHPELALILINHGAELNIFEAASTGQLGRVQVLVKERLELVSAYDEFGYPPLSLACFYGNVEVAKYLISRGAIINMPSMNPTRATPLHSAVAKGHLEIVKLLIQHGANLNAGQAGGVTPLHIAARNGNVDMLRILIFHGADPHIKTQDGKLPLDLATEMGHLAAVKFIKSGITKRFFKNPEPGA